MAKPTFANGTPIPDDEVMFDPNPEAHLSPEAKARFEEHMAKLRQAVQEARDKDKKPEDKDAGNQAPSFSPR